MVKVIYKKNFFLKKLPLITLLTLTVYKILLSRYIDIVLKKPYSINILLTVLLYMIFVFFALWNLIDDMKYRSSRLYICTYMIFICFYFAISFYRLCIGIEAKESVYYTIILLGSLSMFRIITNRKCIIRGENTIKEICIFAVAIVIYWLLYVFIIKKYIPYSLINDNIIAAVFIITIPVVFRKLIDTKHNVNNMLFCMVLLICEITCVITIGSRAAFYLLIIELVILLLCNLKKCKFISYLIISTGCSLLVVTALFALDVGQVRYSVYREISIISTKFNNPKTNEIAEVGQTAEKINRSISIEQTAEEQIGRSDAGRKYLIIQSMNQIRQNPLFGTGDLFYEDRIEGMGIFNQSAHNCILETLNCYGIIGLIFMLVLIYSIIFKKMIGYKSFFKYPELPIIILVFLAYGMVQPIVYDELILPLVLIIMNMYLDKSMIN